MHLTFTVRWLNPIFLTGVFLTTWVLSGCLPFEPATPSAVEENEVPPTVTVSSASPVPETAEQLTMRWWTPELLAPSADSEAGRVLQRQVDLFNQTYPTVTLQVELKSPYGRGGILDFLRTARTAAPTVLPDIVSIDVAELELAIRDGLLQPMGDWLPDEIEADLYPFALQVGLYGGQLYAIQYDADIEHLAVDMSRVSEPPRRWAEVLQTGERYIFAAGGRDGIVNDAFLIHYLGAGGRMNVEQHNLELDYHMLLEVFGTYEQARLANVLTEQVLDFNTVDAAWSAFRNGEAALSHVRATRFLADRSLISQVAFGAIPTAEGLPVAISRGWALGIITDDPARQELAAHFIHALLQTETLGPWSRASGRLPASRSALASWTLTMHMSHSCISNSKQPFPAPPVLPIWITPARYKVPFSMLSVAARLRQKQWTSYWLQWRGCNFYQWDRKGHSGNVWES